MSKEITKAYIIQQIADKFKLRELTPEVFSFSETVVPIYDIGPHLLSWEVTYAEVSIPSGPAAYNFFTVPETERWKLRGYNVVFMAAGAHTVTGAYINRAGAGNFIYMDMLLGQSVSYAVNLPTPVVVNPGEGIDVYVDSYTATQNLRLYIDYVKEEIR